MDTPQIPPDLEPGPQLDIPAVDKISDSPSTKPEDATTTHTRPESKRKKKTELRTFVKVLHCDLIKDDFWKGRPQLLEQ
jgi:hypothetical protein